ncbi:MAG: hypothetical protein ABIH80_06030, partial [Methanobacteriota archaeon]
QFSLIQVTISLAIIDILSSIMICNFCSKTNWEYKCDGCSLPNFIVNIIGIDKDNPAGGSDTQFGTNNGGGPCRDGDTRACDNHDRCYQTCGSNRLRCDTNMLSDMMNTCLSSSEPWYIKSVCIDWAIIYYQGLRFGGLVAYAQRQSEVCSCRIF